MRCTLCNSVFDIVCCNITASCFSKFTSEKKKAWKCPTCLSKQPKMDNTNTPIRSASHALSESNVTLRNVSKARPRRRSSDDIPDLDSNSNADIRSIIREEMKLALRSVTDELHSIADKVSAFEQSLIFFNTCYEELKKKLDDKVGVIDQLQKSNEELQVRVRDLERDVIGRLNLMEQHQRECNIEVNGVPENRSENVVKLTEQLAKNVDCPITDGDIVHASRVAKQNKESDRPRSIVVKLRTRLVRDSLLAGVQKFNKLNSQSKLCSLHLGIGGNRVPVFVSEHLSPANKAIHAAVRRKAKELSFKFVWVRDGRVYTRKDENSAALLIRTMDNKFFSFTRETSTR